MGRCEAECRGSHVYVTVWIGTDADHLALAGHLCCRKEEWEELCRLLHEVAIIGESLGSPV